MHISKTARAQIALIKRRGKYHTYILTTEVYPDCCWLRINFQDRYQPRRNVFIPVLIPNNLQNTAILDFTNGVFSVNG